MTTELNRALPIGHFYVAVMGNTPLHGLPYMHRRTGQHPFGGGQTEFCPNGFSGGGEIAEILRDPYSVGGGGVVAENFRDPF